MSSDQDETQPATAESGEPNTPPAEAQHQHDDSVTEAIRRRAYEISQSADAGTPEENWERAEREINAAG